MRYILFILMLLACSKVKYAPIEGVVLPETRFVWDARTLDVFDERIDVLVAFLWPEKIETDVEKSGARRVISRSRELRKFKESFLAEKVRLQKNFVDNDCLCVLDGICTGEETNDDLELCEVLEEKKYQHQATLADFYLIVEDIRDTVNAIGGLWVKTNTEYPEAPLSVMDYRKQNIRLEVFETAHDSAAISSDLVLDFDNGFPEVRTSLIIEDRAWVIEASLDVRGNSLSGQGEISVDFPSGLRKGIIYWEQSPR